MKDSNVTTFQAMSMVRLRDLINENRKVRMECLPSQYTRNIAWKLKLSKILKTGKAIKLFLF